MFDFENKPQHWVNRLSFLLRAEVQQTIAAAGHDVTAEEWAMLMLLWADAPQSMTALAARSLRDRTTVTRLLDGLVAKGLVVRLPDRDDRRRTQISLSDNGKALEEPLTQLVGQSIMRSNAGLTQDEITTTVRVLRHMTDNLLGGEPK